VEAGGSNPLTPTNIPIIEAHGSLKVGGFFYGRDDSKLSRTGPAGLKCN
jgi:hypothetical protein